MIGVVVAVGRERFRWAFPLKAFDGFFRWSPIEGDLVCH